MAPSDQISDLPQEYFDREDVTLVVGLHLADRADEASVVAFLVDADQVKELSCVKLASLTLGVAEVGFL